MQKKSLYVVLTLAWSVALYVVFSGFTYHADFKMGYILTDKIFAEYQPIVEANKTIEAETQKLEKKIQDMSSEYETKYQEYENRKLMLSDTKKAETEKELTDLGLAIQQFQQENFDPNAGTLANKWNEMLQPILEEIQEVIDRIGVEEGYDLIFDTQSGFVLYANEEYDMTDKILEELNKE